MTQFGPVNNQNSLVTHLHTLPLNAVSIRSGFWAKQQQLNRNASLPHGYAMLIEAGNLHNMRVAAGLEEGSFKGLWFTDSDLYKWLEAAAWELAREPDAELQRMVDSVIPLIEAAQMEDGYINTYYQIVKPESRWVDMDHGHELYCAGHLIEAAVAFHNALGDDRLLQVATKLTNHLYTLFGPNGRDETDGHPESELALIALYRVTGDPRHLELGKLFIDRRGRNRMKGHAGYGSSYLQDHIPVREAREVDGHAVRQLYLNMGATDLYMETGDKALYEAMLRLWHDMTERKMYITGGVGSRYDGECFGAPYELPSDTCYCETCASIASFMWNWRMLLLTGDRKYADLMERVVLNGVLPSLGQEGASYLYVNPLQIRGGSYVRSGPIGEGSGELHRPKWHACACCPPNVMRLLSSIQHYAASTQADALQIHQYVSGAVNVTLPAGEVSLALHTDYPWDGAVTVEVEKAPQSPWTLALRIPAWAKTFSIQINGQTTDAQVSNLGYLEITRTWQAGDRVELGLPVVPVWTRANPRVDAIRGSVALERGPLVYCFESHDQPANADLGDASVDVHKIPQPVEKAIPGGGIALKVEAFAPQSPVEEELYLPADKVHVQPQNAVELIAIPYYAWGNRGMRTMRVWIPENKG